MIKVVVIIGKELGSLLKRTVWCDIWYLELGVSVLSRDMAEEVD